MTWLVTTGLTNALVAVLLAGTAYGLGRWLKRPALTHVLWVLVLIKLLTPPVFPVPIGWRIDPAIFGELAPVAAVEPMSVAENCPAPSGVGVACEAPAAGPAPIAAASIAPVKAAPARRLVSAAPPAWLAILAAPANWLRAAVAVWFIGSAAIALLFLWRTRRFQQYLRLAARNDAELDARLSELARSARLDSRPHIVTVESAISPMLFGLGRSAVLIFPAALNRQLAPAARDTLLLHELAHYARGDHWVRLVELLAQVVFWWHPVVWWARRELEAAEEECCDAWVVERHAGVPRLYAEALLATIDFLCEAPAPLPPAACGLGDVPLLRARLTQIIRGRLPEQLCPATKTAVFLAAMFVLPVFPALFDSAVAAAPAAVITAAVETVTPEFTPVTLDPAVELTSVPPVDEPAGGMNATMAEVLKYVRPPRRAKLYATAVSPDGRYKVEIREGYQATLFQGLIPNRLIRDPINLAEPLAKCVAFSPNSLSLAAGNDNGHVSLYDCSSGGLSKRLKGATAPVRTVAFSPDSEGRQVAAGAADGSVIVWDVATGDFRILLAPGPVPAICVRWSSDGRWLAVSLGDDLAEPDAATLVICSTEKGEIRGQFALPAAAGAIEWQDDDRTILSADYGGEYTIRQIADGQVLSQGQMDRTRVSAAQLSPNATPGIAEQLVARAAP
ncbi:MAG TPA: M56 family metallopeptidase [Pirellulaceae bacterium]|nr:M56 family metallopeptidase [Pirellulaceae bacterium]